MKKIPYTPTHPHNQRLNPRALRHYAIQQIQQKVGSSDARKLRVIVRGNNFNNVVMWVEGPDNILQKLPNPIFYKDFPVNYEKVVKPSATKRQWIPLLVVPFLIGLIIVSLMAKKRPIPFTVQDIDEKVHIVNKNVEYWSTTRSNLKFNPRPYTNYRMQANFSRSQCTGTPQAQFVITIRQLYQDKAVLFNSQKYTTSTGGDPSTFRMEQDLCRFVNNHYVDERNEVIELVKRFMPRVSIPLKGIEISIPTEEIFAELAYIIAKIALGYNSCTEVLIKGYADGQDSYWSENQDSAYRYHYVPLYPKVNKGGSDSFSFYHFEEYIEVPLVYKNSDLPNLRAMYVNEVFVKPIIDQCGISNNLSSHIIEGHEYQTKDQLKRTVQVFVVFFQ